jgi:hypothetical protein
VFSVSCYSEQVLRTSLSMSPGAGHWWLAYAPSNSGGRDQEDLDSKPAQAVCETLSQKYSTQNRAGGVTQVIELLSSKNEAPSSNDSTAKTKLCLLVQIHKNSSGVPIHSSGLLLICRTCSFSKVFGTNIYSHH